MSSNNLMNSSTIHIYYKPNYPPISTSKILEICSEYGPIKRSNVITSSKSNNDNDNKSQKQNQHITITYLNNEDATNAIDNMNSNSNSKNKIIEENGVNYTITNILSQENINKQSKNRIIIRNISFYANEHDIKRVLEMKYGTGSVNNIHLPMIPVQHNNISDDKKKQKQQHRGFAFVVFDDNKSALDAINDKKIMIKKRECRMEFSESKDDYIQKKKQQEEKNNSGSDIVDKGIDDEEVDDNDDDKSVDSDSSNDTNSTSSSDSSSSDSSSSSNSTSSPEEIPKTITKKPVIDKTDIIQNSIFLHNLPYTITRKDIMEELFSKYATQITKIFFPKDSQTGQLKGSAFIYFDNPHVAETILQLYSGKNNGNDGGDDDDGDGNNNMLNIQGRTIQVSKPFTNNLSSILPSNTNNMNEKKDNKTMDKRHLYLQYPTIPSRPNDDDINIPQSDKYKRLQSKKDRNTKIKSPLFIINPKRLSIRNLSKSVSTMELRELISDALKLALGQKMVTLSDVVLHYKSEGYSVNQIQYDDSICCIPDYDEKIMNKYIRNIQILKNDNNTTTTKGAKDNNDKGSKGFAFVDFEYHVHALAVVRQLDNNVQYSKDYALGGNYAYKPSYQKQQKKKIKKKKNSKNKDVPEEENKGYPRLIVEFAVENKAKMIKHELSQQKKLKLKKERKELQKFNKNNDDNVLSKKRKSRGQKQREQKRKKREMLQLQEGNEVEGGVDEQQKEEKNVHNNKMMKEIVKTKKPPKKKKNMNNNDEQFDTLVSKYKQQLFSNYNKSNSKSTTAVSNSSIDDDTTAKNDDEGIKKRWFEEDD